MKNHDNRWTAVTSDLPVRRSRKALTPDEVDALVREPTAAGEGPEVGEVDQLAIATHVRFGRGIDQFRRPDWVGELSHLRADTDTVFERLLEHVLADPHHDTLTTVQIVLNDLGRTDHASLISRIDQDLMDRITSAGKEG